MQPWFELNRNYLQDRKLILLPFSETPCFENRRTTVCREIRRKRWKQL